MVARKRSTHTVEDIVMNGLPEHGITGAQVQALLVRGKKPFECMECGRKMTTAQAERMECPSCGGSDIDIA
jgi:Zn finger protein HypA/HybF involved in hydrogenase expression